MACFDTPHSIPDCLQSLHHLADFAQEEQMIIKPQGNNLLVENIKIKDSTPQGIILPKGLEGYGNLAFARVVARGPGLILQSGAYAAMTINIGDIVLFPTHINAIPIEFESAIAPESLTPKTRPAKPVAVTGNRHGTQP